MTEVCVLEVGGTGRSAWLPGRRIGKTGSEEDEIKGKKKDAIHTQDVLAYWMCYQQVQQTGFHSKRQRIFKTGKGNSARQEMLRVWTKTQMQCYICLKGKKHIQLRDQEKLYKGDVPLSWSFLCERSSCQCPEWQAGAGGSRREGPGMDMRILDKQALAAGPCFCSSEWTKAWL